MVPLYLGVRAVVAKSFARIHTANLINNGILPLTFKNASDYDLVKEGDMIKLNSIHNGLKTGVVKATVGNHEVDLEVNLSERGREIMMRGGVLRV